MKTPIHLRRRTCLLILSALLVVTLFNQCSQEEDPDPAVTPGDEQGDEQVDKRFKFAKSEVNVLEVASLIATGVTLPEKYAGEVAGEEVELLKSSDSTLTFVVPEVAEGEHFLAFGESRVKIRVKVPEIGDPGKMLTSISKTFDEAMAGMVPLTEEETAEVEEAKQFKDEVIALFESLSQDDQRRAMLFYEANKATFHEFINAVSTQLDGESTMRIASISDCPRYRLPFLLRMQRGKP